MAIAPIDLIELIKAVGGFIAIVCVPLATVYIMITASRTKELNTKIDGMLVDRDASNVRKGERRGEDKAEVLAEGQRQGREIARADQIARNLENNDRPLPVKDDAAAEIATRTADAMEVTAEAQKVTAEAQKRIADVAEATEMKK